MIVIYISTYSKLKCYINIACIRGLKYKTLEIATITDRKHRVTLFNYNTLCRQYILTHTACELNALYAFTRSGFSRLPLISLTFQRSDQQRIINGETQLDSLQLIFLEYHSTSSNIENAAKFYHSLWHDLNASAFDMAMYQMFQPIKIIYFK